VTDRRKALLDGTGRGGSGAVRRQPPIAARHGCAHASTAVGAFRRQFAHATGTTPRSYRLTFRYI
jgi:hypothetical protein